MTFHLKQKQDFIHNEDFAWNITEQIDKNIQIFNLNKID